MGCIYSEVHRPDETESNFYPVCSNEHIKGFFYQTKKYTIEQSERYHKSSPSIALPSCTGKSEFPLTPSMLAKGKDVESVFYRDISAITEPYHRHWKFPCWVRHSKTSKFCSCDSGGVYNAYTHRHDTNTLNTTPGPAFQGSSRKQNNMKMTCTRICDSLGGARYTTEQLLCTSLLAMVKY